MWDIVRCMVSASRAVRAHCARVKCVRCTLLHTRGACARYACNMRAGVRARRTVCAGCAHEIWSAVHACARWPQSVQAGYNMRQAHEVHDVDLRVEHASARDAQPVHIAQKKKAYNVSEIVQGSSMCTVCTVNMPAGHAGARGAPSVCTLCT